MGVDDVGSVRPREPETDGRRVGPSSAVTSVVDGRMSRDTHTCRLGLRMTCASAVAGMVIRMPRSAARAMRASTRRSSRSSAIKPPASKVMPLKWRGSSRHSFCVVAGEQEGRRPRHFSLVDHRFAVACRPASRSTQPHRQDRFQRCALQTQKHSLLRRQRPAPAFLRSDYPEA